MSVMKVILFGATGMVGQGVLRECLLDPSVESVLTVVRKPTGKSEPKVKELVHSDFYDFASAAAELTGYDACFFCLGVSSAGMKEKDYHRITYDIALAAARVLVEKNPGMTMIYVSGAGTDGSERGRSMWARVKGKTENALLALPFKAAYMFRPAIIRPLHGVTSRTAVYRVFYTAFGPALGLLKAIAPKWVTTTEQVGLAMLRATKNGAPKKVLENDDICALAATPA
jgi:uncharacterized protein YbjT (DUF2867 family)